MKPIYPKRPLPVLVSTNSTDPLSPKIGDRGPTLWTIVYCHLNTACFFVGEKMDLPIPTGVFQWVSNQIRQQISWLFLFRISLLVSIKCVGRNVKVGIVYRKSFRLRASLPIWTDDRDVGIKVLWWPMEEGFAHYIAACVWDIWESLSSEIFFFFALLLLSFQGDWHKRSVSGVFV